ncbi:MoaD/ThiS family protein [Candidatus Bipolaricaulota bacterium]|nr:MoaD/ThiS family protein [Candidatus Bipolaricaulota bacterium]
MNIEIWIEVAFSFKSDLPDTLNPMIVAEGSSVLQALRALVDAAPAVSDRIFDAGGSVRRHINVLVNGGNVTLRNAFATKLRNGDRLTVLPPVGGG